MRRLEGAIAFLWSLLLAGCATSAVDMAPERPDRPWTPAVTADGEMIAGERGVSAAKGGYLLPANPAISVMPAAPTFDPIKEYSLSELIDLAESRNPTTRIAWNDARRVALAAGIAQSAYLPRITASAIGGHQSSSGPETALGASFNNNGSASGSVSAVTLQWLLFDFGERGAVVDAAKQASLISNIAFTAAHQQVIYAVTQAFYAHAAAKARFATAAQSQKNAKAVQAAAEDRYKRGTGTVIEAAQAKQGTAQANLAVIQTTGGAQDAYFGLLTAMGISPLTKIRIADVSGRRLTPSMTTPVETLIAQSLSRRPDVQSAYAAQKASLAIVRASEAEFMPKVFLLANGTYNSGGLQVTALPSAGQQPPTVNINGSNLGGSVFAGVTIPLYDGGTRAAALGQARAEADSAEARLTRVQEEAVRQIVLAENTLRTGLSAYSAAQSLATAARTTFDAALAAYRSGVGSITDLTLAQTQLLQAQNASTDAYSAALTSAATLALATGALGAAPR
ncbi:outer membrane efflux protein [Methylocella silvestris BL2]|uniref:Protein CyaE n=1 Tax=Methylocella silvestris (strain DSM 15510 / CIP 108128 / LMG 27833 / NCIMB 13906 / BL2) TaxID=395965 RepID=B8ESY9_METSB|nr:TolC family protein [Methylocella silvestris]ACK51127.1 outer membrane efflux protein [Methylocella silvestris BL2]